jgi:hypothetical protein
MSVAKELFLDDEVDFKERRKPGGGVGVTG